MLQQIVEVFGILAFAVSGFVEARRKHMDAVGVFTVAFITAFGGGTLRDLLLDRRPLFWVEHQEYTLLVFALAVAGTTLLRRVRMRVPDRFITIADALGLGLFSASGTALALQAGLPWFVCVMMGVITGIFGGVLRDMICNEIPLVFRRGQLYATCAFAGCWTYLLLRELAPGVAASQEFSLAASVLVTVGMRLAAMRYNLRLPG